MRMVDDFLLISYSLEEARNFIYSMQTGLLCFVVCLLGRISTSA